MHARRTVRGGRRLRRTLVLAAGLSMVVAQAASAAWLVGSLASSASARTISVPAVTGVTATAAGDGSATVTWQAAALPSGAGPARYQVLAYPQAGGAARVPGGSCAGTGGLVETTTCRDNSVPAGTWVYRVTAHLASWAGPESDPSTAATVTVAPRDCTTDAPCSVFAGTVPASAVDANDGQPIETGMKFRSSQAGQVTAIRFYKASADSSSYTGRLYTGTGTLLGATDPTSLSGTGWMELPLTSPVPVNADTTYVTAYYSASGAFAYTPGGGPDGLQNGVSDPPLEALAAGQDGPNGVYRYGGGFPTSTPATAGANYWADVVFVHGADTTAPTVGSTVPAADATEVPVGGDVTATFDEPVDPATVTETTFTLAPTAGGPDVPATVSVSGDTVRLHPDAALALDTDYTARLAGGAAGITDAAGNPLAADHTWSFRTAATDEVTLFGSATPGTTDDGADYELGVRFSSSIDGVVTGIRFYKGTGNTGPHTGRLWDATTQELLGTVTFTGESATGWQTAYFDTPLPVRAGTSYIASYSAPAGHYAHQASYFTDSDHTSGPLTAPRSTPTAGNGVFSETPGQFPTSSFNDSNYFVDVTFQSGADTTPPTVTDRSPAPGATGVASGDPVSATFSEPVKASSVSGSTFTLSDAAGPVPAGVSATGATVTLTPDAPLDPGTQYTATLKGGAAGITDLAGNPLAGDVTWTFTTEASFSGTYTIFGNAPGGAAHGPDGGQSIEVGVKLRTSQSGYVSAVRFYKPFTEGDSFTGRLYTASGTLLGEGTTTLPANATGWQQIPLASPVPLSPGTTYVATYLSPTGRYAATPGGLVDAAVTNGPVTALRSGTDGPNGVYVYGGGFPSFSATTPANYWADVVFDTGPPPDTTAPTVTTRSPAPDSTGVSTATDITVGFSEDVDPATVSASTVTVEAAGGAPVPATVGYDAATRTATVTPSSALQAGTVHTVTVTTGVKDLAGNALVAPDSWTFTTAAASPAPAAQVAGSTQAAVDKGTGGSSPPAASVVDSTEADFGAGTGDGTSVRPDGDGAVALATATDAGTFTSRVFDAGRTSVWGAVTLDDEVPEGTSVAVEVRTGDTPAPDPTWSAFAPVAVGAEPSSAGRYLQYRLVLSSDDPGVTPLVRCVRFEGP